MSIDHCELLEKSPLAIAVSDPSERIYWCNQKLLDTLRLSEGEVIGRLYPSLPIEAIDEDAQLVQVFSDDCKEEIRLHYWQATLQQPAGHRVHYFTADRSSNRKRTLATAKLGRGQLPKKASWIDFLNYEVSRSRRYNNPLSLIKLHLCVLKKPASVAEETLNQTINDTLMDELRWADMIGHTDLGSYLLVLPETPLEALQALLNKLESAINRKIEFISQEIDYRLVFGQACWQRHDDAQLLLKRARADLVVQLEALIASE